MKKIILFIFLILPSSVFAGSTPYKTRTLDCNNLGDYVAIQDFACGYLDDDGRNIVDSDVNINGATFKLYRGQANTYTEYFVGFTEQPGNYYSNITLPNNDYFQFNFQIPTISVFKDSIEQSINVKSVSRDGVNHFYYGYVPYVIHFSSDHTLVPYFDQFSNNSSAFSGLFNGYREVMTVQNNALVFDYDLYVQFYTELGFYTGTTSGGEYYPGMDYYNFRYLSLNRNYSENTSSFWFSNTYGIDWHFEITSIKYVDFNYYYYLLQNAATARVNEDSLESLESIRSGISDLWDEIVNPHAQHWDEVYNNSSSIFSSFTDDDHGLSGIVTAPLRLLREGFILNDNKTLSFTIYNKTITLSNGSQFWSRIPTIKTFLNTIELGLISYYCLKGIFKTIEDMKNPDSKNDGVELMKL